jgi:hypothetical protein
MTRLGTRARRIKRIAAAMPIFGELTAHGTDVDSVWWARRSDRDENPGLWLTTPFSRNGRGDEPLAESNYRVISEDIERVSAFGTDYRIDLWPGGQIHTLQVRADDALALRAVDQWIGALADYPVADDSDYSEEEWKQNHPDADDNCYSDDTDCQCGREKA